jgi:threonine synthase
LSRLYHSTRDVAQSVTSKQAILTGIAPDGGLYVSDDLLETRIDLLEVIKKTSTQQLVAS